MSQEQQKAPQKIFPVRFQVKEYQQVEFFVNPEPGTKPEDILTEEYFSFVAFKVRLFNIFHVVPDDGAWYGRYIVVGCTEKDVRLKLLEIVELVVVSEDEAGPYKRVFRGPRKWSVIRKSDNTILSEDHQNKEEASLWLENHLKGSRAA